MSEESGKCPCCNNPWSKATGDLFAKLCETCTNEEQKQSLSSSVGTAAISRDNLDESVAPSANFFFYANGGWMRNNPIPPEYPSWNCFLALHLKSQENLLELLNELQNKDAATLSADEAKVATFYASAINEDALEKLGIEPMKNLLELIDEVVNALRSDQKDEYAKLLGKFVAIYGMYKCRSAASSIANIPFSTNTFICLDSLV
jgi:putative endopeptidase